MKGEELILDHSDFRLASKFIKEYMEKEYLKATTLHFSTFPYFYHKTYILLET